MFIPSTTAETETPEPAATAPLENTINRGPAFMGRRADRFSTGLSGSRNWRQPLAGTNFHAGEKDLAELMQLGQEFMEEALLKHVPELFQPENVNAPFEQGIMTAVRETIQIAAERTSSANKRDILEMLEEMEDDFAQKLSQYGLKGDGRGSDSMQHLHQEVKAAFSTMVLNMKKHSGMHGPAAKPAASEPDLFEVQERSAAHQEALVAELREYDRSYGPRPQFMPVGDMVETGRKAIVAKVLATLHTPASAGNSEANVQAINAAKLELFTRREDLTLLIEKAYDTAMTGPKTEAQPLVTMAQYSKRLSGGWPYVKEELNNAEFSPRASLLITDAYQTAAKQLEAGEMRQHMQASLAAGDVVIPQLTGVVR